MYDKPPHRRIISSISSSVRSCSSWTRLRWLLKLSSRGHDFSLDLHPCTWQRYLFLGPEAGAAWGCLLLVCLSRSFVVLNPRVHVQPGYSHTKGFLCRRSCFLSHLSYMLITYSTTILQFRLCLDGLTTCWTSQAGWLLYYGTCDWNWPSIYGPRITHCLTDA